MPVERTQAAPYGEQEPTLFEVEPIEIEIDDGMEVQLEPDQFDPTSIGHYDNLADYLDENDLAHIGSELLSMYRADKSSRTEWEETYKDGLKLMGLKHEDMNEPFEGACGVFHPLLAESVVRFQSHAVMETFPASGPVKTKIIGKQTSERVKQAERVREDMNYVSTETMTEYRDEHERLLFCLPIAGSAFKKMYYDEKKGRPVGIFVSAEDVVVSYGASNIESCSRITHVMREPENELLKAIVSGFYRDVGDLPVPQPEYSEVQEAQDNLTGITPAIEYDDRHMLLEMQLELDLPEPFNDPDGIARPYIVTILADGQVLSVRRNWEEGDETFKPRQYFTHYVYLPGFGFYGLGLIHLIGGLSKSATSLLRQLIDAGQFANLPAGFKAKGFRAKGQDEPFRPGEWRDLDVPGDKVRDSLMPLPYKEPSTVLYQLLQTVTEEGRRLGSIADVDINDSGSETPVGTTLAMMERSLKIMSAVQSRLHKAMGKELKLLSKIIQNHMPAEYPFETDEGASRATDYDGRVDVIPVSDPNASTMAQKVVQYQVAMQAAQNAPHIYDMRRLHRGMLEVMQIKDASDIIPMDEDMKPKDPVAENMAILKGEPVRVFDHQDHEAHIAAHLAAMEDPQIQAIVGQSPNASALQGAAQAHVVEHVAWAYRRRMEEAMGTQLPETDSPIPPDTEAQLSPIIAEAGRRVLQRSKQEEERKKNQELLDDPMVQIQLREMKLKEKKHDDETILEREKIRSQERIAGAKVGADIATDASEISSKEKIAGVKSGIDIIKSKDQRDAQLSSRSNDKGNSGGNS